MHSQRVDAVIIFVFMKSKILCVVCIMSCALARAQYPYHKAITVKTNMLSLVHLAVELPFYDYLTVELGYRRIGYTLFADGNHIEAQSKRLNLKYHFPRVGEKGNNYSTYLFVGMNNLQRTLTISEPFEEGRFNVTRCVLGAGVKKRRFDAWIAIEPVIDTVENVYRKQTGPTQFITETWLPEIGVSAGFAINLFHIKVGGRG